MAVRCVDCGKPTAHGPRLSFKELAHDFGQFSHSQKMEYRFAFTNTRMAEAIREFLHEHADAWLPVKSDPAYVAGIVANGSPWSCLGCLAAELQNVPVINLPAKRRECCWVERSPSSSHPLERHSPSRRLHSSCCFSTRSPSARIGSTEW